jgi:hypothetical protein
VAKPKPLDIPPFPRLKWDDIYWAGKATLPAWADFWDGAGSVSPKATVILFVNCADEEEPTPPTPAHAAAFRDLIDRGEAIRDAVLEASAKYARGVLKGYPDARERVEAHLGEPLGRGEQMRRVVARPIVHVLPTELDGRAYVGFEFSAFWDPEHGFGVLTHGERVIAVGDAETATDTTVAERDRKRQGKPKK